MSERDTRTGGVERGSVLRHKEDGTKYVIEDAEDGTVFVGELGDRLLDDCPVGYGDRCIDPECDGRVGETERDEETLSAHELYCYRCGLNWVERGTTWTETYADWPTSFPFEESEASATQTTGVDRSDGGEDADV